MQRPKIGLALGSGGARGFAHLGVLKVFVEKGIPIDYIAGSSMGALVASLYAAGKDVDRLYKLAKMFKRKYFLDFTVPKLGFITGNRVKEFIRMFTFGKNIEELDIPVQIVATDLIKGERVVFKEGPIAEAVRASISIPGIFVPEKINGKILVDGGVIDRVPVTVVREMGADFIIAVDVNNVKTNTTVTSIYDVIMQSLDILQMELVQTKVLQANVVIRPKLELYSSRAFTNIDEIIKIGETEAEKHVEEIKERIASWKEQH